MYENSTNNYVPTISNIYCTNFSRWIEDVKKYAGGQVMRVLVGTKLDLAETNRQVQVSDAQQLAAAEDMLTYLETSSKNDVNIEKMFVVMASSLKEKHIHLQGLEKSKSEIINPSKHPTVPIEKEGGCC